MNSFFSIVYSGSRNQIMIEDGDTLIMRFIHITIKELYIHNKIWAHKRKVVLSIYSNYFGNDNVLLKTT